MRGTCKCVLCQVRARPQGWLTGRAERLRGFELELDDKGMSFSRTACIGHLKKCETEKECRALVPAQQEGDCDCEVCRAEQPAAVGWKCPGHSCLEMNSGDPRTLLLKVVKRAAAAAGFRTHGNFTDWRKTERDNEFFDLKTDRSCGYEIATPPVTGKMVEKMLGPVLAALGNLEQMHKTSFATQRCGLHCTYDVQDLGLRGIKQILFTVSRHQAALVGTQPAYRRGNQFCKFLPGMDHPTGTARERCGCVKCSVSKSTTFESSAWQIPALADHHALVDVAKGKHGLVEFRFGGATLDLKEIQAYSVLGECVIDASITRPEVSASNNRKRRLYEEIIAPYLKDSRVVEAWEEVLKPRLEKGELARA